MLHSSKISANITISIWARILAKGVFMKRL